MLQTNIDVAGTGFTVLDRVYENDRQPFESLGGSCGNVLVSLAMLDRKVAPVLALGRDSVGDQIVNEFEAAGADTRFISRRHDRLSPILAQSLNTEIGQHSFSFTCPETNEEYPRYAPIEDYEVSRAEKALDTCSVFFTDRLSDAILEAMKLAFNAGAVCYFEPSAMDDELLFEQALKYTSVLKFSSDRLHEFAGSSDLAEDTILVATHGSEGLEVFKRGEQSRWFGSVEARVVRDTCGSGDMVSVGMIDWIVRHRQSVDSLDAFTGGIRAGQRLAAANCSFAGARGLFSRYGADLARRIMNNEEIDALSQLDFFEPAFH